ncbi:MAG: hypothetical protein QME63_01640, partial [Actinomycetota bacterium]|nr:hypothetical protein [Actinomycetota bacterium]
LPLKGEGIWFSSPSKKRGGVFGCSPPLRDLVGLSLLVRFRPKAFRTTMDKRQEDLIAKFLNLRIKISRRDR